MPLHNSTSSDESSTLNRRRFLAASAGAGAVALAGCSAIVDFFTGFILEDVNVLNGVSRQVAGSITVQDPTDATVLDESFVLAANQEGTNADNESDGENNDTGNDSQNGTASIETYDQHENNTENQTDDNISDDNTTDDNISDDTNDTEPTAAEEGEPMGRYSNVFTDTGEYTVSVELEEGESIRGASSAEKTVEITDTGDEHIMVLLGTDEEQEIEEPILIQAIDDFSDLDGVSQDEATNSSN
jgi:hypothetical protein